MIGTALKMKGSQPMQRREKYIWAVLTNFDGGASKEIRKMKEPAAPKLGRRIEPNVWMRVLNGFPPLRLTSRPISFEM